MNVGSSNVCFRLYTAEALRRLKGKISVFGGFFVVVVVWTRRIAQKEGLCYRVWSDVTHLSGLY